MKNLTLLLNNLIFTSSNNKKVDLIVEYLKVTPLDDRGYAIALLSNNLKFDNFKSSLIKKVIKSKIDSYMFELSYDYVGDLAETVALIWQGKSHSSDMPLNKLVKILRKDTLDKEKFIIDYLDSSSIDERWTFIKLVLGGLRVGVSSIIVKKALSIYGKKRLFDIEKIWNAIDPPYKSLFDWLDNKKAYPNVDLGSIFHPLMLAYSIDEKKELEKFNLDNFIIEYKWDGIRVQIVTKDNNIRIFSRGGEDITKSFPDIDIRQKDLLVLDGELLIGKGFKERSFNDLQKRINKKKPSKKLMLEYPAFIRLYDILFYNGEDLRKKSLTQRKKYLKEWYNGSNKSCYDLSQILKFKSLVEFKKNKNLITNNANIEGFMLKFKNSSYISGRKRGHWYKWKRDPSFLDVILMYAQRGHGKRSSYYSDYTFGVWDSNQVVPIAKAYSGYTDKELNKIDSFIRRKTIAKFGPVREIKKELVIEIAFDSINLSKRHKSGISLRFPRIHRIRWDKPVNEVMSIIDIKKEFF